MIFVDDEVFTAEQTFTNVDVLLSFFTLIATFLGAVKIVPVIDTFVLLAADDALKSLFGWHSSNNVVSEEIVPKTSMEFQMLGLSHDRQIRYVIVRRVAINMVDNISHRNLAVVVRPHRTVKKNDFEVMPILVLGLAVDDAVEALVRLVDLLDLEPVAVHLVNEILDGGFLQRSLGGGSQHLKNFLLVFHGDYHLSKIGSWLIVNKKTAPHIRASQ